MTAIYGSVEGGGGFFLSAASSQARKGEEAKSMNGVAAGCTWRSCTTLHGRLEASWLTVAMTVMVRTYVYVLGCVAWIRKKKKKGTEICCSFSLRESKCNWKP